MTNLSVHTHNSESRNVGDCQQVTSCSEISHGTHNSESSGSVPSYQPCSELPNNPEYYVTYYIAVCYRDSELFTLLARERTGTT
jgi:hypothetical protein